MRVVATMLATVEVSGPCSFMAVATDEIRESTFDPASSFLGTAATETALIEAITAPVRWTRARLLFDRQPVISEKIGDVDMASEMVVAQLRTVRFSAIGPNWSVPSVSAPIVPFEPCDPVVTPPNAPYRRLWGNKPVEIRFAVGKSSAGMQEIKIFGGRAMTKASNGDISIQAPIEAVDLSIEWADIPLCFGLQPFSGFRRGEITRMLAASIGIPDSKIFVPLGGVVNKAIVLNNLSLLPFLGEFLEVENWFPYFDDDGNLRVEEIQVKYEQPDWIHDFSQGDIDLKTFKEILPDQPPNRYYVTSAFPIKSVSPAENALALTEKQVTAEFGYYNPLCVKVRPSTLPSYIQVPDGNGVQQYRSRPSQEFMEIGRVETERTTVDGVLVHEILRTWEMYNPLAYDPNYDTYPAGTSYNGAYGDKTHHLFENESLMLVKEEVTDNLLDEFGTMLGIRNVLLEWYAPKRGILYNTPPRTGPKNFPGTPSYIFPEGKGVTARQISVETFQVVEISTRDFDYTVDGTLRTQTERRDRITDPQSRCDVTATGLPPGADAGPKTPASDPLLQLEIIGPTRREVGVRFVFQLTLPGWVDTFLLNQNGVHPGLLVLLQAGGALTPILTYTPRSNRTSHRPLPGASTILQYVPGQFINASAGKLTAEIYVDLPQVPPYVTASGTVGAGVRNEFDGNVYLWVVGQMQVTGTPTYMNIVPNYMPKLFQAYAPGAFPGQGI